MMDLKRKIQNVNADGIARLLDVRPPGSPSRLEEKRVLQVGDVLQGGYLNAVTRIETGSRSAVGTQTVEGTDREAFVRPLIWEFTVDGTGITGDELVWSVRDSKDSLNQEFANEIERGRFGQSAASNVVYVSSFVDDGTVEDVVELPSNGPLFSPVLSDHKLEVSILKVPQGTWSLTWKLKYITVPENTELPQ